MSEPILVLGMHRSGTSSVAGVLIKLGGQSPKTLMPADRWNARGFFESAAIMALNDELLASAGSSWDDWRRLSPSWFSSAEADVFRKRAKELFGSEFGSSSLPILKDPRICRFAPFWLDIFREQGAKPRTVIPIRSPLEVAQSLHKIYRMPLTKGLLIWLRHVLDAEADSRNVARSIFSWDEFLSDWRATVNKIGVETGVAWPRLSAAAAHEIEGFIGSELVHQRVAPAELAVHPKVHEWTLEGYEALCELARSPFSNSAIEKLNELKALFDRSCAMFGSVLKDYEMRIDDMTAGMATYSDEKDRLQRLAADLNAALAAARGESRRLSSELVRAATSERASAQAALDVLRKNEELSQALTTQRAEAARAAAEREHLIEATKNAEAEARHCAEREAAAREGALKAAHAAALSASARRADAQIGTLTRQLVESEARAAKLARESADTLVWKLLSPLRRRVASLRLLRSGLFDEEWYVSQYPNAANGRSPLEHFLVEGYLGGYQPNPFFDPFWYLEHYEDVRRSGMNPLVHYLLHGAAEGRDPGPRFKTSFYLSLNPDVRDCGLNPLAHYLRHGQFEGRQAAPRV